MSDVPAPTAGRTYSHIVPRFTSWIDPYSGNAIEGYEITALWNSTLHQLTVRIPSASYTADAVDRAIRAAGAQDEAIANLGA